MTSDEILTLAHREAWRYKKSSDPHHSDTYTFNRQTLLEFARKLTEAEREACAELCLKTGIKTAAQSGQEACAVAIRARSNAQATGAAPTNGERNQ